MSRFPLYYEFIHLKLKSMVEYRGAFIMFSFSKALVFSASMIMGWVLISRFDPIAGWNAYEVMFLVALNLTGYALAGFFLYHASNGLPGEIQNGELDALLTKPLHP